LSEEVETAGGVRRASASGEAISSGRMLLRGEEADAPDVHVDPDDERQEHHREEGTEYRLLRHVALLGGLRIAVA
jgi:hypothetical protein